ncbi:hypothetical protein PLESTB_000384700 [Pleodorina starrii]|uniref:Uncharacterized protein n=1 Tax=Pleodorina starrii TaxID=330485 RepID=A0A9W6BET7_9CHLO|nr:hypothetical protein PLESTM_000010200 [Pleodorina starrii]GLC50485.1 hypothetical protein PLESTB_000384700 [Pleodorina starrii]GLC73279.1 hypothetical protein PLESTF_001355400 [Pleodorina starrii]
MSVSPLPVHISCYGVSADAVNLARGYKKHSYADRLATVRSSLIQASPDSGSAALSSIVSGSSTGNGTQAAAQASPARQTPQIKLQPLGADTAHQILGGNGGGSAPAPLSSGHNSLRYRSHTKHVKTVTPTLQALDFISIAVNSVGGGGVPRPYGKFQACRAGDGNAKWERLPPPPGSWQARALPIAVTLLGDSPSSAGMPKPESPRSGWHRSGDSNRSRTTSPSASAASSPRRPLPPHGSTSDGALGHVSRVGADGSRLRLNYTSPEGGNYGSQGPDEAVHRPGRSHSQPSPAGGGGNSPFGAARGGGGAPAREAPKPPGAVPAAAGLHEQSYYRRPGSSLHRSLVPLPPPEPHSLGAWFALPAATFLADVPKVPEQLRMDNGYSVSREFLLSGLNPPRRPPPPASPPRSPPHAHLLGFPLQPQSHAQQQHQQHLSQGAGLDPNTPQPPLHHPYLTQSPPEVLQQESLAVWNALEGGAAAAAAQQHQLQQQQQQQYQGGPAAPGMLRGVYVPLEKRLQEPAAAEPPPPLAEAVALGSPGGAAPLRGRLRLPSEVTLPRRAEPTGW